MHHLEGTGDDFLQMVVYLVQFHALRLATHGKVAIAESESHCVLGVLENGLSYPGSLNFLRSDGVGELEHFDLRARLSLVKCDGEPPRLIIQVDISAASESQPLSPAAVCSHAHACTW